MDATDGLHELRQRARGALQVTSRLSGAMTRLADLRQEGCLRACFPRGEAGPLHVVTLNTSGGMTDGDRLDTRLAAGAGAFMVVASQAAERVYRARCGAEAARVCVHIDIAGSGRVDYLPQETILFDGSALERRLTVDMDAEGTYLGVEILVFGRAASGEVLRDIRLRDRVIVRRGGRLVLHDGVILNGQAAAILRGPATAHGAGAIASLVYASPDASSVLEPLRERLAGERAACGASFRDGMVLARIVARDGAGARRAVLAGLGMLRGRNPLPRVWTC
jgi:urease accessory protein